MDYRRIQRIWKRRETIYNGDMGGNANTIDNLESKYKKGDWIKFISGQPCIHLRRYADGDSIIKAITSQLTYISEKRAI